MEGRERTWDTVTTTAVAGGLALNVIVCIPYYQGSLLIYAEH